MSEIGVVGVELVVAGWVNLYEPCDQWLLRGAVMGVGGA